MEFLGGILSAGANLLGGMFNRSSAADINAKNIAESEYQATHSIQEKVADAKAAGINPLAALGVSSINPATVVGDTSFGQGVSNAGQDLGRAASSVLKDPKEQMLKEDLLRAQIANTQSDTIKNTAAASAMAVKSQPGTPPGVRVPMPTPSPFTRDTLPLYQDYRDGRGGRLTMLSHDASQSVMNAASLPLAVPIGAGLIGRNIPNAYDSLQVPNEGVRGDVFRGYDNSQYAPF